MNVKSLFLTLLIGASLTMANTTHCGFVTGVLLWGATKAVGYAVAGAVGFFVPPALPPIIVATEIAAQALATAGTIAPTL